MSENGGKLHPFLQEKDWWLTSIGLGKEIVYIIPNISEAVHSLDEPIPDFRHAKFVVTFTYT